jgi:hypothetical protein
MSKSNGAPRAQPQTDAERRAKNAARKREVYWADPEQARATYNAKRARRLEHYKTVRRERRRQARVRAQGRDAARRYRQRYPEKIAAHRAVETAIRKGEIVVPTTCEVLGCSCDHDLALHHSSYRPQDVLKVTTLCRTHHGQLHRNGGEPLRLKASAGRRWARAPRHDDRPN